MSYPSYITDLGDDELNARLLQRGCTEREATRLVRNRDWPDVGWLIFHILEDDLD